MGSTSAVILCLAYMVGLLATAISWGGVIVLGCGMVAAISLPRIKPGHFIAQTWMIAGIIGLVAGLYLQIRSPHPSAHDISRFVPDKAQEVTVSGQVEELPRLTRTGKVQIWLNVTGLETTTEKVGGKLYVTLPKQAFDFYPGKAIAVTGSLYKPKPAMNPGGFNFQKYLAQEGSFAGLKGRSIQVIDPTQKPQWGWWMIQQRIVRSQAERLGTTEGALVSAMVLGSRVVDIPFDTKDAFTKIGLSHALAASGFQISLILGVVLTLTRQFPKAIQVVCGATGLIIFVGLAGAEPAILRAVLMGSAALIGLALDRKVKPLNSLLLVATILLVIFPAWIWSLSFQFSFLATLGLLVTVPALTKKLDWLPTMVVPAIAVPIAAFLWTLPLQLYRFGIVSPYSILVNLMTTILISIISIGGIISAVFAIISPSIGGLVAGSLYYPTQALITTVHFFCRLPGNSIAVGTISAGLTLVLYGLICLPWFQPRVQRLWWAIGLIGISLVFVPAGYTRANLFQITVMSAGREPILVVQDHGRTGLINSGDTSTANLTILPFLQKEGINQIDWAIAANKSEPNGWTVILERVPVKTLYDLSAPKKPVLNAQTVQALKTHQGKYFSLAAEESHKMGAITFHPLSLEPTIVQFQIGQQRWLWLKDVPNVQQKNELPQSVLARNHVIWWSGRKIHPKLLELLKPEVAIAYSNKINPETLNQLQQNQVQVYQPNQDGALQWMPDQGFRVTSEFDETDGSLL